MKMQSKSMTKAGIFNYKDIFFILTQKEIKLRYKSKVLGYFWSLLNPILLTVLYYVVFSLIIKIKIENYPAFLVTGLFPWQWVGNSLGVSPSIFISNSSLIKKMNFPKNILVQVVVAQDAFHYVLTLPVVIFVLVFYGIPISWKLILFYPLLVFLQSTLIYSMSLFISTLNLFLRDIENLVKFFLMFAMYMTPIMYSADMIPENYRELILLNPFALLIISWRDVFLRGDLNFLYVACLFGYVIIFHSISTFVYRKLSYRFAEVL
jgi:lipopolysaccharide transport system permease protein